MTTNSYAILRQAVLTRQPVTCRYKNHVREVCPHILGTTRGRETVLAWQFAGGSSSGLPSGGEWRCMYVDEMTLVVITPGKWHSGRDQRWDQTCVEKVDVDVAKP